MERLYRAFEEAGKELFLVGGAVRELARGVDMKLIDDLDFCTNARPEETLAILKAQDLVIYDVGIEYGTVGCVLYHDEREGYPKDCQITTYRSEEYYRRGSRHPSVSYGDTIMQDLKRRDFSINSIAMNAAGEYIDPYDGLGDLQRGLLRVVGDPHETLAEDPLRILRVGRFIAKLGFDADEDLRDACVQRAENILDISRERWLQEMTKLLKGPHADKGMDFLDEVGIIELILPEVHALKDLHTTSPVHHKDMWAHTLQVLMQAERTNAQRWGALLHDIGKVPTRKIDEEHGVSFHQHEQVGAEMFPPIAERFKFDNHLTREVRAIILHHGRIARYEKTWSDAAVRRLVRELDPYTESLLMFARADLTTSFEEKRVAALDRIDHLRGRIEAMERAQALRPNLPTGLGKQIMEAFDLKPSPRIGELKKILEEAIMEGTLENNADAAFYIAYLRRVESW